MTAPIRRALLSVSDKSGIDTFARALTDAGVELLSTGGTFAAIQKAGVPVREVSDYTGFPEMMNGRIKTLHPKVHGGILALREEPSHVAAMDEHGISGIDLVVVNLYPFEATVAKDNVDRAEAVTNNHVRPDNAQTLHEGNVITGWPTKLALAPALAQRIAGMIGPVLLALAGAVVAIRNITFLAGKRAQGAPEPTSGLHNGE